MTTKCVKCYSILVAIIIGVGFTGACRPFTNITESPTISSTPISVPSATTTPKSTITKSPTLESLFTQTPEPIPTFTPSADDGVYFPVPWIRLGYDPTKWEKKAFIPEVSFVINWSEPTLVHRLIANCYLGANNPRDFGPNFELRNRIEIIGEHQYSVLEFFSTSDGGQLGAAVYNFDIALEYLPQSQECITDAKEVLATYVQVQP